MVARKPRILKSGTAYNAMIPACKGDSIIINSKNATVEQTIAEIKVIVGSTLGQTDKVAQKLKGKNLADTCSKIWHWLYEHVQYEEDSKFQEQLREPARLWHDRKGDCDCYSITMSSILTNLGIPHLLRITKYNYKPNFQHIYVIVPRNGNTRGGFDQFKNRSEYLVIDPVTDKNNYEVFYTDKRDYEMELARLNGLDGDELEGLDGSFLQRVRTNQQARQSFNQKHLRKKHAAYGGRLHTGWKQFHGTGEDELMIVHSQQLEDGSFAGIDENGDGYHFSEEHILEGFEGFDGLGRGWLKNIVNRAGDSVAGKVFKAVTAPVRVVGMAAQNIAKGQSIKASIKNAGSQAIHDTKEGISILNAFNPLTIMTRNGILAILKLNMFNSAGKLRYAYLSDAEAIKRGIQISSLERVRHAKSNLEETFRTMGGKQEALQHAILNNKGNRSSDAIHGLGSYDEVTFDGIDGLEGWNGFGIAPAAAAAPIAAATPFVVKVMSLIGKAAPIFSKAKELLAKKKGQKSESEQFNANADGNESALLPAPQLQEAQQIIASGNPNATGTTEEMLQNAQARMTQALTTPAAGDKKDNTKMYLIGGLGLVGLAALTFAATRQKTSNAPAYSTRPTLGRVPRKKKKKTSKHSKTVVKF